MPRIGVKGRVKESRHNRSYSQRVPSSSNFVTDAKAKNNNESFSAFNTIDLRSEPSLTTTKDQLPSCSIKENNPATKENQKLEVVQQSTKEVKRKDVNHVVEFWQRCAMLENFIYSYRNCNVRLESEESYPNINYTVNTNYQCEHVDGKPELDIHTLSTFMLLNDERFQIAAQCLIDAKKLIMHFHEVDYDDDVGRVIEKSSFLSNVEECETETSTSDSHHVSELNKPFAIDKTKNYYLRVETKNDQYYQEKCQVDASKEHVVNVEVLNKPEPLLLSELHNVNESFSHWRYWLPLAHVEAFIALLELSESALPSRTNWLHEVSAKGITSSMKYWWLEEKCVWVTSPLRASQYNLEERHIISYITTAKGDETKRNDIVNYDDGSHEESNQAVKVAMCLCPINERVIDARLREVNRIWHLRRVHSTLMPRIQSCATLTDVNTLFFAYPNDVLHKLLLYWENQHSGNVKSITCAHDVNVDGQKHKRFAGEQVCERTAERQVFWLPTIEMLKQNTMYTLPLPESTNSTHHLLSISHSDDNSNYTSYLHGAKADLHHFESRSLHLCEEQLLHRFLTLCNHACLIDSNTWGVVGLRPALRCTDGIYWVDCWNRSVVLSKVIELAEWYGLPPFLRSIRRHSMSSYASRKIDTIGGTTRASININKAENNEYNIESNKSKRVGRHNTEMRLPHTTEHETHALYSHFLLFLSPELLNKTYFTEPDPVQMQVVREEIIDLTIKHCAFGMIIGEVDQIVHLLVTHCEYQRALVETRLGNCTRQHCTNPLAKFMKNTLDKVHQREKETSTSVSNVSSTDNTLRNNLISAEVDWICDNRWSDELTYYGIIYAVVKHDNTSSSDDGITNTSYKTADTMIQDNNKLDATDNMLHYIAAVIEYKR